MLCWRKMNCWIWVLARKELLRESNATVTRKHSHFINTYLLEVLGRIYFNFLRKQIKHIISVITRRYVLCFNTDHLFSKIHRNSTQKLNHIFGSQMTSSVEDSAEVFEGSGSSSLMKNWAAARQETVLSPLLLDLQKAGKRPHNPLYRVQWKTYYI